MDRFDSHCHLDDTSDSGDRETVFERALCGRGLAHDDHRPDPWHIACGLALIGETDLALMPRLGDHRPDAQEPQRCCAGLPGEDVRSLEVGAGGEIGLDFNPQQPPGTSRKSRAPVKAAPWTAAEPRAAA